MLFSGESVYGCACVRACVACVCVCVCVCVCGLKHHVIVTLLTFLFCSLKLAC